MVSKPFHRKNQEEPWAAMLQDVNTAKPGCLHSENGANDAEIYRSSIWSPVLDRPH